MIRIILTFGLISGFVIIAASTGMIVWFSTQGHHSNVFLGYLVMLVGLSAVLVGVRQYRDQTLGGVIKFWPALGLGLGIALAASCMYVAGWEVYMAATHYGFANDYASHMLAKAQASGVTGAKYQALVTQMDDFKRQYANPLYRLPMTFMEIAPVGLLVALVSAGLLRNPKFLPAKVRA